MEQTDAHADAGPLLYLVRKTKSSPNEEELRASENRKIECAKAHFGPALGVDYKVVPNADKLP